MENASKALIIAGAILLSILIISLGIFIFTQASNTIKSSGMSDAQIEAFNSKFTKYEGSRKGSDIRTLVQEVLANNNNDQASDETVVAIDGVVTLKGEVGSTSPNYGTLKNTKTYEVSFDYGNGGRVTTIHVNEAKNK